MSTNEKVIRQARTGRQRRDFIKSYLRRPFAEIFKTQAVDGRFPSFQARHPRWYLPGDDRGEFQRSNGPVSDYTITPKTAEKIKTMPDKLC